jgi:hypothetical protein
MGYAVRVLHYAGAGLLAGLAGCATVVHGTTQTVPITSSPPGAPFTIDGVRIGVTPYDVQLSRRRAHSVRIGADPASRVNFDLGRRASGWLLVDLVVFYPAILVDLVTGAGFAFTRDSLHANFQDARAIAGSPTAPAAATIAAASGSAPEATVPIAPAPDTTTYWGLRRGHALRLTTRESRDTLVDATLDSIVGERLYWRPLTGPSLYGSAFFERNRIDSTQSRTVPLADVRRFEVRRPPAYAMSGASAMHGATQLTWAVPMLLFAEVGSQQRGFRGGAIASAIAIPVAFVAGAAFARHQWAPFEAHRARSPLLVNDQVRLRQLGSAETVSGRLLDVEPKHLVIRVGPETRRVLRTNVVSIERADGFDLRSRAIYGAFAGAIIAYANMGTCACHPGGADVYTVPISGALLGLLASPALAPRRWRSVSSW